MKKLKIYLSTLFIFLSISAGVLNAAELKLTWNTTEELPATLGAENQPGLAGPFTGVYNDVVIMAGGANFPDGAPWYPTKDGGKSYKTYHKAIFILSENEQGQMHWQQAETSLPEIVGYGATVSHPEYGVICIGGERKDPPVDGKQKFTLSDKVFSLKWEDGEIVINDNFPNLPAATTALSAALVGDLIYVVAGDSGNGATKNFWKLDLAKAKTELKWEALNPWQGSARILPVFAAQNDGSGNSLYLFSGRNVHADAVGKKKVDLLTDVWRYDIKAGQWHQLPDIALKNEDPRCIMAGSAVAVGIHHILLIGGASGDLFQKVEFDIPEQIAQAEAAGKTKLAAQLRKDKWNDYDNHPGFSKSIIAFHTVTKTYAEIGKIAGKSPVTCTAVKLGEQIIIPSGEIHPAVRTANTLVFKMEKESSFGALNYTILGGYLSLIVLNGLYFSKKIKSTDDFFKAGSRIPWWAAGISIFVTQLSSMTFLAIPAKIYATDWRLLVSAFAILAVAPFIIMFFLPFYRRLNVTTAYEYLELRFNVFVRCFGSIAFMLLQFSRIGFVLWLPSIALSAASGMDVDLCIILMGILCVIYTCLGGMEAVVWTDVSQAVVLLGGALVCLFIIIWNIPGDIADFISIAEADDKFRLLDFRWNPGSNAFFTIFAGALCANFISYGTDQAVVQRYLTTKNEKDAAKSIWTNALLAIPASCLFFMIGTALYVYYKTQPELLNPIMGRTEEIFPAFIIEQLPNGIAGLLIAAVFAASMSSLDSSMNSVSAAVTTDFYRRFKKNISEESCLRVARIVSIIIGLLGIFFALAMVHSDIKSIWDHMAFYIGLFGGGLGGVFFLGIFTKRCNGMGASCGLILSGVLQFCLKEYSDMNPWFFAFTGLAACFIIGYIASSFFKSEKSIKDLTIYDLKRS